MRLFRSLAKIPSITLRRSHLHTTAILISLTAISLGSNTAQSQSAPPPVASAPAPAPCASPQNRQFDFWVGRWDVYPKKSPDKKIAHSLIEGLYSGCAVRENWMPLVPGGDGGSINSYRPEDGLWHQTWIDSTGAWVEFTGKWNGTSMVLEGVWPQPGHPTQRTRMTYTHLPDGSVEQAGQSSDDEGKSWQPSFDLIYRPATDQKDQKAQQ
jgi:hypothetical protein